MSTSTLTRLAPTRVELEIPLPPEEVAAAQDRAFMRLSRRAKLPGFRPGKVPRKLFEQAYGTYEIEHEALDDVAPAVYERALREHDLDPVDRPKLELLPDEDGKPARLKATVEVRPEIDLGEYKGVEVEAPAFEVTDDDVERALRSLARDHATLVPIERAAQLGDVVTIDYEGRIDGELFEGGSAQRRETELAEESFISGFASGIAGMTVGETKVVEATFPAEYAKEEYAGKTAAFTVTLHEVKEIELPVLDDDFAKSASETQSIAELREEIGKRLNAIAQGRRRRYVGNAVMEKLLERIEVPLPDALVSREIESSLSQIQQQSERVGMSLEDYWAKSGETEEQALGRFRQEAGVQVKGTLVLEAVAKAEGLEATAADVKVEIEALARSYGQTPERMRRALGSNLEPLKESIIRSKAMDMLVDNATVRAVQPNESTEV